MLKSLAAIKRAAESAGSHWFEPAALRFFSSEFPGGVYPVPGGALFISSEQFKGFGNLPDGERLYSLRSATDDGKIQTVGKFQGFRTIRAARAEAKALARDGFSLL